MGTKNFKIFTGREKVKDSRCYKGYCHEIKKMALRLKSYSLPRPRSEFGVYSSRRFPPPTQQSTSLLRQAPLL